MVDNQELKNTQQLVQSSEVNEQVSKSQLKNEVSYPDASLNLQLEQYKIYVEMTDRVSTRRGQTNAFYTSLLTGLLAAISLIVEKGSSGNTQSRLAGLHGFLALLVAILGLFLSLVWYLNIRSYKQLNSLKFQVIHEIEAYLPFKLYSREWEILKADRANKYLRQTNVEQYIPFAIGGLYLSLFIYVIVSMIK